MLFLKDRLKPVAPPDGPRLKQLLVDLESDNAGLRDQAAAVLEQLGDVAVPLMRERLKAKLPLETQKRVELVLQKIHDRGPSAADLQGLRALEVLRLVGNEAAQALLQNLAAGAAGHRVTEEARESLRRLTLKGF